MVSRNPNAWTYLPETPVEEQDEMWCEAMGLSPETREEDR